MYNLFQLKEKGAEFRRRFSEVDFVGEIEITEIELNILCSSLWKSIDRIYCDPDLRALLTTVVVNLAYYTREECDSESFRWLVLKKLSNSSIEDHGLWAEYVGLPTLRTLEEHFQVRDIPGRAYRFVRPIMQQAGVPYSTIPQFVNFFLQLERQYGIPFSFQVYERFRANHQVQSHTLANFLNSEAGYHYCKEIGRIYKNIQNQFLTRSEIDELPPRIRETVKALCQNLVSDHSSRSEIVSISLPQLALDKEQLQLKLLFPFDEFHSPVTYHLEEGGIVCHSSYLLSPEELQCDKITGYATFDNIKEKWEIKIWQPEIEPWAVFSPTSGAFIQSNGSIPPGEYLVVISDKYNLLNISDECNLLNIYENCGFFYYPCNTAFRVFRAELKTGFEIPEINFKVGTGSRIAPPQLRFSSSEKTVPYGANIFIGKLPSIIIDDWNENARENYFLLLNKGNQTIRISDDQIINSVVNYPFEAPVQARLRVEPKSKTAREFRQSMLSFTLLPDDFSFSWENLLYEKSDTPEFQIAPADKIEIYKNTSSINADEPGKYRVQPGIDLFELHLKYADSTCFSLTVPIYRLSITSPLIENNLLWQEKLTQRAEINLTLSPNERGQNIELGLVTRKETFKKICDTKPVSKNFSLLLTTDEVRDALSDCGIPIGILAVKTRSSRTLKSDVVYVNEALITSHAFDIDEEEFSEWLDYLPSDLGESIKNKRRAHLLGDVQSKDLETSVPEIVEEWLTDTQQNFVVVKNSVRDFCRNCRNKHWQKAAETEVGSTVEGKIMIESVKLYNDSLEALGDNNQSKYIRCLESSYRSLKKITGSCGIVPQIASFIRLMCCLRLGEIEYAEEELPLLDGDYWLGIKSLLKHKFPGQAFEPVTTTEVFKLDDVVIHNQDLEFLNS
jgi:hypothetical protein